MLRLSSHTLPNATKQSLNVLTGELRILRDGAEWDDNGVDTALEEEVEPEDELPVSPYVTD
jgi:hypothetical protein